MRSLPSLVLLLVAAPLGAAEAYRWVDKDGVVHYSDKPAPGAESIMLTPAPKPGSVAQTYTPPPPRPGQAPEARYTECRITAPAKAQTFGIADSVSVVVETQPALQPGDRLQVTLNGSRIEGWPAGSSTHQISGLPRGEYTVLAVVTGPSGLAKCTTAASTFNVFQPSLLSPGRAPR